MKTDIDIKDEVFSIIKGSALANAVSGKVSKTLRPANSNAEDIVVSILSNDNGEVQDALVNVNIYVQDNIRDNQSEENSTRLRTLCDLAKDLFLLQKKNGSRIILDSQRVISVEGKKEHCINNRLHYKICNEY